MNSEHYRRHNRITQMRLKTHISSNSYRTYLQPFVCEMPLDLETSLRNNIHNRTNDDIRRAINEWVPTPSAYTVLEYQCLFSNRGGDTEEISDIEDEKDENADSLDAISDEDNANAERYMDDDEFSDTGGDEGPMNEVSFLKPDLNFQLHSILY